MTDILNLLNYLFQADLRMAAPVLTAALGLLIMEKSGVINIGCEGNMLTGAFAAVFFARLFNSPWLGLLGAGAAGLLTGVLFGLVVVLLKADQIVAGISFNFMALGLTTTLNRMVFGISAQAAKAPGFSKIHIPVLSSIPVLGALFSQPAPVYLLFLFIPLLHYFFRNTAAGLRVRSAGENPQAAYTAGINVQAVRLWSVISGSFLTAAGGGFMALGYLNHFTENMISGRGYIALAALILGKWKPGGILAAALLFGLGEALQIKLQMTDSGIPYQFLMMLPYILTILALAGLVGQSEAPKASGKPFYNN